MDAVAEGAEEIVPEDPEIEGGEGHVAGCTLVFQVDSEGLETMPICGPYRSTIFQP